MCFCAPRCVVVLGGVSLHYFSSASVPLWSCVFFFFHRCVCARVCQSMCVCVVEVRCFDLSGKT